MRGANTGRNFSFTESVEHNFNICAVAYILITANALAEWFQLMNNSSFSLT